MVLPSLLEGNDTQQMSDTAGSFGGAGPANQRAQFPTSKLSKKGQKLAVFDIQSLTPRHTTPSFPHCTFYGLRYAAAVLLAYALDNGGMGSTAAHVFRNQVTRPVRVIEFKEALDATCRPQFPSASWARPRTPGQSIRLL